MTRSVLEQTGSPSASSDSSPVLVAAPECQRSPGRPVETEEDESDGDEVEAIEAIEAIETKNASDTEKKRSSRRLQTKLGVARMPLSSTDHEDANSVSSLSTSRYALRTRHVNSERFDESIYNDVFMNSIAAYHDPTPAVSSMNSKKRRRCRGRSRNRRANRLRCRVDEEEDDEEEEEEDDDEEGDDPLGQEMSMREINKKIKMQGREERERSQVLPRQGRPLRYALRSRGSLTMSEESSASSFCRRTKRSPLGLGVTDNDHAEAEHDRGEDEGVQSENDDANSEDAGGDDDDDNVEEEPARAGRYYLRQRRQAPVGNSMTTRSRSKVGSVPAFERGDTSRRYSLRDRSKTHRTGTNEDVTASPETPAYAEYLKRRAGRTSRRIRGGLPKVVEEVEAHAPISCLWK
ncbi:unnamed protein product [Hyaloperonospora brassicae]|uniref:Shugoshin C-terminal domain-containing protein n=1 Tax=Hyaloperonospora brassicae TaxID=162125 RepID=A0AAV0TE88_HYABA|nr:unnamed protein product [Hyaloperonospora brassicae]